MEAPVQQWISRFARYLWLMPWCVVAMVGLGTGHSVAQDRIVLGMSAPFSGPNGLYGKQMREGIEACFARINAGGGIHGRQLRLEALDDGYEVEKAVANARHLIDKEKVFALMGFYGTASTTAVLPVLDAMDMLLIGTISGADVLRNPPNPHIFHLRASYGDETAAIIANLLTVGIKRVAVLYQDDGFGQAGLQGVKAALALQKLEPVAVAAVPRNSLEVNAAVTTIANSKPEAVVMATLAQTTAAFVKQMRSQGGSRYYVALSPVGTDQLVAALGEELARGIQVAQVIPYPWADKLPIVREYKEALARYSKKATISYYGLEGYLNAKLVATALDRAGTAPTRERVAAALRGGSFDFGGYRLVFAPGTNSGSHYVEISVIGSNGRILN
jgi:ABC-type branched-subunit amino acid transport system substrate-binding protein